MSKKLTYKEAISEVEEILEAIENDELDVDDLSEKVKRVTFLLNFCKEKLFKTQEDVEKVLKGSNGDH